MTGLLITTSALVAQNLFARTYGRNGVDIAYSIVQTSDGGYAVAGYMTGFGASFEDFFLLKVDAYGALDWLRTFGGSEPDIAYSLAQTSDGGYAVAGSTFSFGSGYDDCMILKLNSSGGLEWAKTFGAVYLPQSWEEAYSIIQASDGGYAVCGSMTYSGAEDGDVLVFKTSSYGTLEWAKEIGVMGWDEAFSLVQTSDGGYAVAGGTRSLGAGSADFLVLKLSSSGTLEWARTFGDMNSDACANSIIQTSDGGYAVAGGIYISATADYEIAVIKLNSSGGLQWARTFGELSSVDYAYSIVQTSDGGYALAGETNGGCLIMKLDPSGGPVWAKTYGGTNSNFRSVIQSQDGGYVAAGYTESVGNGDFLILKLDRNGDYPDCVQPFSPAIGIPTLTTSSPTGLTDISLQTSAPSPTINTPTITATDACQPVDVGERAGESGIPGIAVRFLPSGVLFDSPEAMAIRVYAADGRLAYSGKLQKGENRISLDLGVYLWQAGPYKGKAVVR
jgi:hypothetical protein